MREPYTPNSKINATLVFCLTAEELQKVERLKKELTIKRFNEVFMDWVDKVLTEIQLKDLEGIMYVITD